MKRFLRSITPKGVFEFVVGVFAIIGVVFTALTYFGTEPISDQISSVLGRMAEIFDEMPKASNDPIDKLASRNYEFTPQAFIRAIKTGDDTAVSLFCEAASPNWLTLPSRGTLLDVDYSSEIHTELSDCAAFNSEQFCKLDHISTFTSYDNEANRREVYQHFCGPEGIDDVLERSRALQRKRDAEILEQAVQTESRCAQIADEIRAKVTKDRVPQHFTFVFRDLTNDMRPFRSGPSFQECRDAGIDMDAVWKEATRPFS